MSTPGWLQRSTLIDHMNSVHMTVSGAVLPEAVRDNFQLCPRCNMVLTSRGCHACCGKPAHPTRTADPPVLHAAQQAGNASRYDGLPDPQTVLATFIRVMRHVPNGVRIPFCDALRDCIQRFTELSSKQTLTLVFLLPKVVLASTGRGGKRGKRQVAHVCLQRLERWSNGEYALLWKETLEQRAGPIMQDVRGDNTDRTQDEEVRHLQRRILDILSEKGLSKAAKELVSDGVHNSSPSVLQKLRDLHPRADEPVVADAYPPAQCSWTQNAESTEASIKTVIQQFPAASGADPSQLRPAHLKEAAFCGSDIAEQSLLHALQRFVSKAASGLLPPELSEAKWTAQ